MVNGVSMVESVWSMVFQLSSLYGQWCFNGGIVWSMVFQWWRLYGEWCFNGRVCMVNGVSMVVYDGEWCFNGGIVTPFTIQTPPLKHH